MVQWEKFKKKNLISGITNKNRFCDQIINTIKPWSLYMRRALPQHVWQVIACIRLCWTKLRVSVAYVIRNLFSHFPFFCFRHASLQSRTMTAPCLFPTQQIWAYIVVIIVVNDGMSLLMVPSARPSLLMGIFMRRILRKRTFTVELCKVNKLCYLGDCCCGFVPAICQFVGFWLRLSNSPNC